MPMKNLFKYSIMIIEFCWSLIKFLFKLMQSLAILFITLIPSIFSAIYWGVILWLGYVFFLVISIYVVFAVLESFNIFPPGDKTTALILSGVFYLGLIIILFKTKKLSWGKILAWESFAEGMLKIIEIWEDNNTQKPLSWTADLLNGQEKNIQYANNGNDQIGSTTKNTQGDTELLNYVEELLKENEKPDNKERAIRILENLAEKGLPQAQVRLSYLYLGNKGICQNHGRAFHWASMAANKKIPEGLFNLGLFYTEGIGTKVDYELAYNSLLMASKMYTSNEDKGECYIRLGDFVRHGVGRDINLEQALSLYSTALEHGNEEAKIKVKETQEIIARQHSDPAFSLEQAERLRWGRGTDKNAFLAIPFYERAARLGDSYSQTELAYFFMGNDGIACDYSKVYYWATKASGKTAEANYYLAFCYHHGYGVGENGPSALNCYMNFINGNVPDSEYLKRLKARAKYQIGCLHRDGKCGATDYLKALEWFELAQQAGYVEAEKAAKEVRDYLEQQKNKSNKESFKLISCPGCSVNIRIPTPVPTAIIRCKACNVRLSIKQDNHGNIHVLLLNDTKQKGEQSSDMPMTLEDAARILGVTIHDDLSIIKNAWRTLRGQYHPDKLNQMGDKLKELAEIESKKINKAYQILSNR